MTDSIFDCLTSAWTIVIKRFRNSNLVKDAPADYWEDDFFVSLAKKDDWAVQYYDDCENQIQSLSRDENEDVPNDSESKSKCELKPEDAEAIIFLLSKLHKSQFSNEREQIEFRSSFIIALEKFVPLDDEEADLLRAAKEVVSCCKSDPLPKGAEYMIAEWSGSGCTDYSPLIEQALTALTEIESRNKQEASTPPSDEDAGCSVVPIVTLNTSDVSIIREACSNGRFEAAFNLAIALNKNFELLTGGVSKWMTPLVNALKSPAAVECEFVRLKTRLLSFERCQKIYPNFMKLYSTCFLLRFERERMTKTQYGSIVFRRRCQFRVANERLQNETETTERERRIKMIKVLSAAHRYFIEQGWELIDDALQMSEDDVLKISFFLWLKKEYFNRIQDAKIEELEPWIQNHKEEVSLAVAHKAIQMNPDLETLMAGLQKLSKTMDAFGSEERRLLSEGRNLSSAVKCEIEEAEGLRLDKIHLVENLVAKRTKAN